MKIRSMRRNDRVARYDHGRLLTVASFVEHGPVITVVAEAGDALMQH